MKHFDLYGFGEANDLDLAKQQLESVLGIRFSLHESSFHGGEYYRYGDIGGEEFLVQRNYDPTTDEWAEEAFQKHPIILYVNATERHDSISNAIKTQMHEVELLRSDKSNGTHLCS
jgi:hypothetical protein